VLDPDSSGLVFVGPTTSIRTLTVAADLGWSGNNAAATTAWLRLLRSATVLESLSVAVPLSSGHFEILREVLRTYNFTLRHVGLRQRAPPGRQQAVDRIVRRNGQIRLDYERAVEYARALETRRLLPEAIARFNKFPALVLRFLRHNAGIFTASQVPV
jgi:hypothetical protein